jgi:hypothetical protein
MRRASRRARRHCPDYVSSPVTSRVFRYNFCDASRLLPLHFFPLLLPHRAETEALHSISDDTVSTLRRLTCILQYYEEKATGNPSGRAQLRATDLQEAVGLAGHLEDLIKAGKIYASIQQATALSPTSGPPTPPSSSPVASGPSFLSRITSQGPN